MNTIRNKEILKKHFKNINIIPDEDELNDLIQINRIDSINIDLLTRVVKHVKIVANETIQNVSNAAISMRQDDSRIEDF